MKKDHTLDYSHVFDGNLTIYRQKINKMIRKEHGADSYKILDRIEQMKTTKSTKHKL